MRRELMIDVDAIHGRYGEYKVLVDDDVVVDGGPIVMLGVMPSSRRIVETVRGRLASPSSTP